MIRRATEADLPEMRRVFDAARAYMAAQGKSEPVGAGVSDGRGASRRYGARRTACAGR